MGTLGRGLATLALAVSIAGTALAQDSTVPSVSVTPTTLDFGHQDVGATSAPQTVTWTNTDSVPMSVAALAQPRDFPIEDTCKAELPAGESCTTTVRFAPATTSRGGSKRASLSRTFSHGAGTRTPRVSLSGQTQPTPPSSRPRPPRPAADYHLSRGTLAFGNARYKKPTKPLTVIITNVGAATGTALRPHVTAGHHGDFSIVATTCRGKQLAVNESCSVTVVAIPKARRERRAELRFLSGPTGPRVTLAVYGLRSKKAKRKAAPPAAKREPVTSTPAS